MFITFEGIDGSGKSTQARALLHRLSESVREAELFREPGGTPASEQIREMLLDPDMTVDPFAELLLFSAARAQLVAERIRPLLEQSVVVICDRFFDSTTAYQGGGRGIADPAWLQEFHHRVTSGLVPDRTYLLSVSPEQAYARRSHRAADRLEEEGHAFYERVARAYDELARAEPERIVVVDAAKSADEIARAVWADIAPRLAAELR
jgi:dTMP kinase